MHSKQVHLIFVRILYVVLNVTGILNIVLSPVEATGMGSIGSIIAISILFLISWTFYLMAAIIQPGYIGYPEPDASNKALCRRLVLHRLHLESQQSSFQRDGQYKPGDQQNMGIGSGERLDSLSNSSNIELAPVVRDNLQQSEVHNPSTIVPTGDDQKQQSEIQDLNSQQNHCLELHHWKDVPRRWCGLCQVHQPIRTKHCYTCGQCVLRFDHHCQFTGMCIGQNNHLWFYLWVCIQNVVMVTVMTMIILSLQYIANQYPQKIDQQQRQYQFGNVNLTEVMVFNCVSLLILFLFWLVVVGVFCYHSYLIASNLLTHEQMMFKQDPSSWPWYFRMAIMGRFTYDRMMMLEDELEYQQVHLSPLCKQDQKERRRCRFAFDQGVLKNFSSFVSLGVRALKLRNRPLVNRYNIYGQVVEFTLHEMNTERNQEPPAYPMQFTDSVSVNNYNNTFEGDGKVSELLLDQSGEIEVPRNFYNSLKTYAEV
ncbi:hypothetical protein MP228_013085 [Amoeboaphelidium protococcarum]|nr:hypothetical protein MP228_013085 [Amoeboaphelidium protococcarum]